MRTGDDAPVWRGTNDASDGRGFEIPELFVADRTYTFTPDIENGD